MCFRNEIAEILPEIEKQIPNNIPIDIFKTIIKSSLENTEDSFNTLKDIYETKFVYFIIFYND